MPEIKCIQWECREGHIVYARDYEVLSICPHPQCATEIRRLRTVMLEYESLEDLMR